MPLEYTARGKYANNAIEIDCEIGAVNRDEAVEIMQLNEVRLMRPHRSGELDTITLSVESMDSADERYWTGIARKLLDTTPNYRVAEAVREDIAQRRAEFDPAASANRDPIADRRGNWPVDQSIKTGCAGRCKRIGV